MQRQDIHIMSITLVSLHISVMIYAHDSIKAVTLNEVINELSLECPEAQVERLNYQNELLLFDNYKKGYLPSISFNLNPVSFNRSLRLLQHPTDGSYSYVEDYSNNSSAGISIRQKIAMTGGELNVSSNINYLNEFSNHRNSFSTTPFSIGYSQQLLGGGKLNRLEKKIEQAKNDIAIKEYCAKLSTIQLKALEYYMTALLGKMEQDLSRKTMLKTDTLLQVARIKLKNGHITEYEVKQIELQATNAQYTYEKTCKKHVEALERMAVFLGTDRMEVEKPIFAVPPLIDSVIIMHYVKQNNPFSKKQEIQALEAERHLYTAKLNSRINGNISLNYGVNKYAETFIDAYRNVNMRQSVVVGFQIPVFQWGINRNRLRIAHNDYEASKIERERQQREFENEIHETINNYNHSVRLWQTAEKAYQLSQEQYAMLIRKFSLGKVSVYELISAQDEQNSALQHYYLTIKDTYVNYYTLRNMALYDFKQNVELEDILAIKQ